MTTTTKLKAQSHSAAINQSDGQPILTYNETYLLQDTSSSLIGVQQARLNFTTATTSGTYPQGITPGAVYADYPFATCKSVSVKKLNTRPTSQMWDVDVEWSTNTAKLDETIPANRRWIREVSDSDQQRFIFRDRNDKLIVDAAGSPFDGGVPVMVKITTYVWEHTIDWNTFDMDAKGNLSGRINSDMFLGKKPGTLMLTYRAKEAWEGTFHIVNETYVIVHDPLGWKPKPANAGLYCLERPLGSNTPIRKRVQVNGKDAVEPEPLYGKDAGAGVGQVVPYASRPQDCNFIEVDYYEPIPFAALGLPTT